MMHSPMQHPLGPPCGGGGPDGGGPDGLGGFGKAALHFSTIAVSMRDGISQHSDGSLAPGPLIQA